MSTENYNIWSNIQFKNNFFAEKDYNSSVKCYVLRSFVSIKFSDNQSCNKNNQI